MTPLVGGLERLQGSPRGTAGYQSAYHFADFKPYFKHKGNHRAIGCNELSQIGNHCNDDRSKHVVAQISINDHERSDVREGSACSSATKPWPKSVETRPLCSVISHTSSFTPSQSYPICLNPAYTHVLQDMSKKCCPGDHTVTTRSPLNLSLVSQASPYVSGGMLKLTHTWILLEQHSTAFA